MCHCDDKEEERVRTQFPVLDLLLTVIMASGNSFLDLCQLSSSVPQGRVPVLSYHPTLKDIQVYCSPHNFFNKRICNFV